MTETLLTERLTLRPITPGDAADLFQVYRDPTAMRFMHIPPRQTVDETRVEIERDLAYQGAVGWAVCLRGEDRLVGYVIFLGETAIPGMGYILHPDYWGQGLIPEACRAALAYGFDVLKYDRVELWINENNARSIRVAQKLGFKLRGHIAQKYHHETTHHVMLVFGLTAGEEDLARAFFKGEPVLSVEDIEKTTAYYRDSLGFRVVFLYGEPPVHAAVSRGGWTGSGVTIQFSKAAAGQAVSPSASIHIQVGTALDALYADYISRGVTVVSEPAVRPWGQRDFSIRDCNGVLLTFATAA